MLATNVTVHPGDWLSKIAPEYGETWQQLYNDNLTVVGSDPNLIYPGQVLVINPGKGAHRAAGSPGVTVHNGTPAAGKAAGGSSAQTTGGALAVAYARAQLGKPYLWGGNGPAAFDCSGLVQQAWKHAGVSIPRTADEMWHQLPRVSLSALRVGDIVAFGYNGAYADHVGIYAGNGQLIDTSSHRAGGGVGIGSLASRWGGGSWHPLGAVRPSGGVHAAVTVQAPAQPDPQAGTGPVTTQSAVQSLAMKIFGSGYSCAANIITRESGWDITATNPSSGAYGLPQSLPGSKMAAAGSDWRTNPATQLQWMLSYVDSAYGGACNAWAFWQGHSYY